MRDYLIPNVDWKDTKTVTMHRKKMVSADLSARGAKDEALRELANKLYNTSSVDEVMNVLRTEFDIKVE